MPCPSSSCQCLTVISITLLTLAFLLWFPYAVRERKTPRKLALVALVAICASILITGLFMPYACQPCGGLP